MNLLIVDDQLSVLDGLLHGLHFETLKITNVYTAANVSAAKEIVKTSNIHILLCDIEMPGENGLSLNKWMLENYPSVLRILLTSHAAFDYAKEAIRLGCFDYIVQPAPYHEIEEVLARAVSSLLSQKQLFDYYTLENLSNIVLNLFSSNPVNKQQSQISLNKMGYLIKEDSAVQAVIIDIYPYINSTIPEFSDAALFDTLLKRASENFCEIDVSPLICLNRYKQFVLLLFCNNHTLDTLSKDTFYTFYQDISKDISEELSCYVTPKDSFQNIRNIIQPGHQCALNNVTKKPGLYFSEQFPSVPESSSLSENVARWSKLLEKSQFTTLKDNIYAFLDYNAFLNHLNLDVLSQFHQELTKLFFIYSYNQKTEVMNLFSSDYSYNDYMGCFKDVQSLKDGISYLINALASASHKDESKDTIQRAVDYILENLSKDISVKDVADYVCFSPEYFSKLFKKETGENVKNYILRIKVNTAKDLLKNPNIPVSLVASELGYSNFSHFTQMFKKHEGITPSEYRKKYGKEFFYE